jgi:hypothetical protein
VGAVDEQTIREYIENQRWDEDHLRVQDHGADGALSQRGPAAPSDGLGRGPTFSRQRGYRLWAVVIFKTAAWGFYLEEGV